MMHPSTMKLVDRLCAMTKQSKIEWTHGEEDGTLLYDTEGYRVILEGEPASIKLTDTNGGELEHVAAGDLADTPHPDEGTYDVAVAGLVADAQRIARGTESAISSVLEGLDLDGDGVVDIPAEDGLVPTPAEISDPQPDVIEDSADETGVATLADADIADMSNAVASLADEVNQAETQQIAETVEHSAETVQDQASHLGATAATGLTAAGLGAAGLIKAAQNTVVPEPPEEAGLPEVADAATDLPDLETDSIDTPTDFGLSDPADTAPLQLTPDPVAEPAEAQETVPENGEFVPPRPGQILSLSGLTTGDHKDIPVMAGTATTMPMTGATDLTAEEAVSPPPAVEVMAAPEAPAAPEPKEVPPPPKPAEATTPAPSEPEVEATKPELEAEPEAPAPPPASSRFNPWI